MDLVNLNLENHSSLSCYMQLKVTIVYYMLEFQVSIERVVKEIQMVYMYSQR